MNGHIFRAVFGFTALAMTTATFAAEKPPAPSVDAPVAVLPADLANRLDAAGKLVGIMHLDKQLDLIMPQIINALLGPLISGNTGHEDQIKAILTEEFATAFASQKGAFLGSYRQIYAKNFTLEELKAMIDFYSTPIGQSVLAKTPSITQDSMKDGAEIGRKAAQTALPRILQRMQAAQFAMPKGT